MNASQELISLLRISIFDICFLMESDGSDRPTISIKKKFALTISGRPMSEMLRPYISTSFRYVSMHFSLSKTKSALAIGLPLMVFPHKAHIDVNMYNTTSLTFFLNLYLVLFREAVYLICKRMSGMI